MFTKRSRYRGLETVTAIDPAGREVAAVKLRRLPGPGGDTHEVHQGDRLDHISQRRYGDGTQYWRIADANTELEAAALVAELGRDIEVPER